MAWAAVGISRRMLQRRMRNRLLREVVAKAVAIPVFLAGLYIALRISGLTQLAATVLGGTGLLGLVIGIAFRDIAENYLASILISMQRPFAMGDRIEVAGCNGFVQSVTTRGTLLMTVDGNHVQIPNATVYKSTIRNFTANPRCRRDFVVGIGYRDSIALAQETALQVLRAHEGVLADPEPLVLVESLTSSAVRLRILFWVDLARHSDGKVLSAVIRHVKQAYQVAHISIPDEAREVVFPDGVNVRMLPELGPGKRPPRERSALAPDPAAREDESASSAAEGHLTSDAETITKQASESRLPDEGENLLGNGGPAAPSEGDNRLAPRPV